MPTPTNIFTSLGFKKGWWRGLGEGHSASPHSRMKAPLLTCYFASFQEKVSHVILRDVNTVQNASFLQNHVFYRCNSLVALSSTIVVLSRQAWQRQAREAEINTELPHTTEKIHSTKMPRHHHMQQQPGQKIHAMKALHQNNASRK